MNREPKTRATLLDTLGSQTDSALRKYQDLYVGSRSLAETLRYELLTFLLSALPGAPGLLLRRLGYRALFAHVGRGCAFGPGVTLRCPRRISLGDRAFIDSDVVLDAKGEGSRIRLGDDVLIGKGTVLSCASAPIELGRDVSIGPHCHVRAGMAPIRIGSLVSIGSHCAIVSGAPGYERLDVPMKHQVGSTRGIELGDDVWLGVGVKIVDGARVGSGSVIGAGAVVIDEIPAFAIAAGVPARVIGTRRAQPEGAARD